MKIPFITGGDNCKYGCNGTGSLIYYVKLFNGDRTTILGQCSCVKAYEATVEHIGTFVSRAGEINRNGKIVPIISEKEKQND